MQILGTTLVKATEAFMHPGYGSAQTRPLVELPSQVPMLKANVAEALQLKSGPAAALHDVAPIQQALSVDPSQWTVLAAAGALFAGLALLALWRRGAPWQRAGGAGLLGALILVGSGTLQGGVPGANAGEPPSAASRPVAYAHPKRATQVIMYGLLAEALDSHQGKVRQLADVRREIGFPTRNLTPGMRQAVRHFTHDGWGRPFRLRRAWQRYTVVSAGPDGRFGTRDDLRLRIPRSTKFDWDEHRRIFYVSRLSREYVVLFHRFPRGNFEFRDRSLAMRLTGNQLFDVIRVKDYRVGFKQPFFTMVYHYRRLARKAQTPPLVLLAYRKGR